MSIREEWEARDQLVIAGERFHVRCRSTFSGDRWSDFEEELRRALAAGLLDGAAHVEVAVATVGDLYQGSSILEVLASVPSRALRTLSLGALLGTPDVARIEQLWGRVATAFPALVHGPNECWRWATKPRMRVMEVGPHFLTVRPNQVFDLAANGEGPWLRLRQPPAGGSAFDALALRLAVNSYNVAELGVDPLEAEDVCRINGRSVATHPLRMERNGTVVDKRTLQWFPLSGDVVEIGGLAVRYEEDEHAGQRAFATREATALFMGGPASTITLDLAVAQPVDDEDE